VSRFVLDNTVTMAWCFNLELAIRHQLPLAAIDSELIKAAQAAGVELVQL